MIFEYKVSGMTCGRCSSHVAEEVREISGVTSVSVDHSSGMMRIEAPERIPFDAVIAAVDEAGDYTVVEA